MCIQIQFPIGWIFLKMTQKLPVLFQQISLWSKHVWCHETRQVFCRWAACVLCHLPAESCYHLPVELKHSSPVQILRRTKTNPSAFVVKQTTISLDVGSMTSIRVIANTDSLFQTPSKNEAETKQTQKSAERRTNVCFHYMLKAGGGGGVESNRGKKLAGFALKSSHSGSVFYEIYEETQF